MRWTRNALKPHYRGWNGVTADHNYNWHDSIHSGGGSCGPNNLAPCDDHGHGTHTTGTTVGDDGAGNQVGVAPGAKWIGCRNMDQGNGTPATYTECFQFFIAPTDLNGQNPDPTLRPHVMNNSWGCPVSEGCTTRGELETIVNNTQAAGIFVEVSAGNAGSGCSTVQDPPAIYEASFSTGAIDISNTLAGFSSRGPSTFYTPNILKPNISAPGGERWLVLSHQRHELRQPVRHLDGWAPRGRRSRLTLVGASTVGARHRHYEDDLAEHSQSGCDGEPSSDLRRYT
jgi:serine protease AprX